MAQLGTSGIFLNHCRFRGFHAESDDYDSLIVGQNQPHTGRPLCTNNTLVRATHGWSAAIETSEQSVNLIQYLQNESRMRERGGSKSGGGEREWVEEEELPNRLSISLSWADVFKGRLEILRKLNYLPLR